MSENQPTDNIEQIFDQLGLNNHQQKSLTDSSFYQQTLQSIITQLTNGCKRDICVNVKCKNNPNFKFEELKDDQVQEQAVTIINSIIDKKAKYELQVCNNEYMKEITHTIQSSNLDKSINYSFMVEYIASPYSLSLSFLKDPSLLCKEDEFGLNKYKINLDEAKVLEFFNKMKEIDTQNEEINNSPQHSNETRLTQLFLQSVQYLKNMIGSYIEQEEDQLTEPSQERYQIVIPYILRGLIIEQMNDLLDHEEYYSELRDINAMVCALIQSYSEANTYYERYIAQLSKQEFLNIVRRLQFQIDQAYQEQSQDINEIMWEAIQLLDAFYKANMKREEDAQINFKEFYNESLNKDFDLQQQYEDWIERKRQIENPDESFVNVENLMSYPWVLDCQSKSEIITLDSRVKMDQEVNNVLFNSLMANPFNNQINQHATYLLLEINREFIIEDTLNSLVREDLNFRKPLRIQFIGELGVDEGGVQKEFFQLLIRKLFDPNYTMFIYQEESRLLWFNGNTFEPNIKFELIGILMGLAIYNNNILDLHLPMACYKKLVNMQPTIQDLYELMPQVAEGLNAILKSDDPDLEQKLYQTFTVEMDYFGHSQIHELLPEGGEVYVNQDNKHEYAYLLIDFYFNQQCEEQFKAFKRGFFKVVTEDIIELFRPEELEQLICGSKILDFKELQGSARYIDGYTEDSIIVSWLWEVIHNDMTDFQRKLFLQFTTGCDRAPINGLGNLILNVGRQGPDTERLPTAHTCFNILLIPEYTDKDKLRVKLLNAIQNSEGFGLY